MLGKEGWRSGTALDVCRPFFLLKPALARKVARFQEMLEQFSNFIINQKVKQINNNPRACVSDQLKRWIHAGSLLPRKWFVFLLQHYQNGPPLTCYIKLIVKTRPLQNPARSLSP